MSKTVKAYMCQIDWECELGEAHPCTALYPSVETLKEQRKCVQGCGIVEVEITLSKVVDVGSRRRRCIREKK